MDIILIMNKIDLIDTNDFKLGIILIWIIIISWIGQSQYVNFFCFSMLTDCLLNWSFFYYMSRCAAESTPYSLWLFQHSSLLHLCALKIGIMNKNSIPQWGGFVCFTVYLTMKIDMLSNVSQTIALLFGLFPPGNPIYKPYYIFVFVWYSRFIQIFTALQAMHIWVKKWGMFWQSGENASFLGSEH